MMERGVLILFVLEGNRRVQPYDTCVNSEFRQVQYDNFANMEDAERTQELKAYTTKLLESREWEVNLGTLLSYSLVNMAIGQAQSLTA